VLLPPTMVPTGAPHPPPIHRHPVVHRKKTQAYDTPHYSALTPHCPVEATVPAPLTRGDPDYVGLGPEVRPDPVKAFHEAKRAEPCPLRHRSRASVLRLATRVRGLRTRCPSPSSATIRPRRNGRRICAHRHVGAWPGLNGVCSGGASTVLPGRARAG